MSKVYRMPDGKHTKNALKMSRAWARIYKPICKEFEVEVIGYDPGLRFSYGSASFDLPTDIAIKVADMINIKKRLEKSRSYPLFSTIPINLKPSRNRQEI